MFHYATASPPLCPFLTHEHMFNTMATCSTAQQHHRPYAHYITLTHFGGRITSEAVIALTLTGINSFRGRITKDDGMSGCFPPSRVTPCGCHISSHQKRAYGNYSTFVALPFINTSFGRAVTHIQFQMRASPMPPENEGSMTNIVTCGDISQHR